jgi:amino-acid N-acetyltransferase
VTGAAHIVIRPAAASDWPAIRALLDAAALPLDGARESLADFIVAQQAGTVVGCAGLERHGDAALLRSCAVDAGLRGGGIGSALTARAIDRARQTGLHQLVLLTTTAADFFARFGFMRIARGDAPESLRASAEFQHACPASAVVMQLDLPPIVK